MKHSAACLAAALFAATVGRSSLCLAAQAGSPVGSSAAVLGVLAGTIVPAAELGSERARGLAINVNGAGAVNSGTSANNFLMDSPVSGSITNDHSINNNAGITSVLQNFGNNSIMQVSTTINITVH